MDGPPEPSDPPAPYLLVVSDPDPVARAVALEWGTPSAWTGDHVDGAPIRRLAPGVLLLRRPERHVSDERLDGRLPSSLRERQPTLLFPSIHRSEQGQACFTVHPLGNPGPAAEVGGRPRTLSPTDPRRMSDALRRLTEAAPSAGLKATLEATHHGPELGLPAFFAEIGFGDAPAPSPAAVRVLARVLPELAPDPQDRVAFAVGGGHYAPHFSDLVVRRSWAVGHILSRHALEGVSAEVARAARDLTPGATGYLAARAADRELDVLAGLGPALRENDAPRRAGATAASGT